MLISRVPDVKKGTAYVSGISAFALRSFVLVKISEETLLWEKAQRLKGRRWKLSGWVG